MSDLRREMMRTVRLAGPLVGGQLAGVGMNFVDTVMAGRLGAVTLGGVALGASSWATALLFMTGVLMVVQASVAHLEGAQRHDEMAPYVNQAGWVALGLAAASIALLRNFEPILVRLEVQPELVPEAMSYLRMLTWGIPALAIYLVLRFYSEGVGDTRPTLFVGVLGLLVNVPTNAVLMFGLGGFPALGAQGCAIATSLVWWLQCLAMLAFVRLSPRHRERRLFSAIEGPRVAALREMLKIGLPIGGAVFLEASMFSIAALLVGTIGTQEMAGHQVAVNFASLAFMVPLGIAMATTVRVGHADGRGDRAGIVRVALAGFLLTLLCQVISAGLMVGVPEWIAAVYTDEAPVAAIAVHLLWFAAIFQLSDGVQVSAAGTLRGLRDTRVPLLITLFAYWGVGIPLGAWLAIPKGGGPAGLWIGMTAGLTVAGVLLAARFAVIVRRH